MELDPKYKIDYSRIKSYCRECRGYIDIRRLRIGKQSKETHGDLQWNYQHAKCFLSPKNTLLEEFLKHHNNSAEKIENYENLELFHRDAIQEIMETDGYITKEMKQKGIVEILEKPCTNIKDFEIKLNNNTEIVCEKCKDIIEKKEMCIYKRSEKLIFHIMCFINDKENIGYYKPVKHMRGFEILSEDYKRQIESPTKRPLKDQNKGALKRARTSLDFNESNEGDSKPKKMVEQALRIDDLKNILEKYERKDLHAILAVNNQDKPFLHSECVVRLADAFAFGALEKCPSGCLSGQLVAYNNGYKCTGIYSENTDCRYTTREPYRSPIVIPEGEIFQPLKMMELQVGVRLFHVSSETEHGDMDESSCAVTAAARDVGGMQPPSPQPGPSTEMSDSGYWTPKSKYIDRHLVKGRGVVHPLSGLTSEAHVYEDSDGNVYSAVLLRIDVQKGLNKCYYLQLLEKNVGTEYIVFRAWGSVGQVQHYMTDPFNQLKNAMTHFMGLFKKKTQQDWNFREYNQKAGPRYYRFSELDYGEHFGKEPGMAPDLSDPVHKLVATICNISAMKITICEYEIDAELMPVGKLAKRQIDAGRDVLTQLLSHFESGGETENEIDDHTNRFFELIPHNFGDNGPPRLNNKKVIQDKIAILEQLRKLHCSYNVLQSGDRLVETVEEKYKKLNTEIEVVPNGSPVFNLIVRYAANSHSPRHDKYSIEVQQVFSVRRNGEAERFEQFRGLHRRLLWHGSFTTSFAGILAEGMQIFEETANGALLGKGLYFADMVSKSANYCGHTHENQYPERGILMLCDVALGEMRRCLVYYKLGPKWLDEEDGNNSVWGIGQLGLEPEYEELDGALVPLGQPVETGYDTDLLQHEYVVPDVRQVKIKYLVCFKFIYNK